MASQGDGGFYDDDDSQSQPFAFATQDESQSQAFQFVDELADAEGLGAAPTQDEDDEVRPGATNTVQPAGAYDAPAVDEAYDAPVCGECGIGDSSSAPPQLCGG